MVQVKEQDENTEIISEVGTGQKEFRVIIVKMIKELGRRIDIKGEKLKVFNIQLENMRTTKQR